TNLNIDASGHFAATGLQDYTYKYTFRVRTGTTYAPAYYTATISEATNTYSDVQVVIQRGVTISGHLEYQDTGLDAERSHAFLSDGAGSFIASADADAHGDYRFAQLPPGTYSLAFQPQIWNYYNASGGSFTVAAGGSVVRNAVFERYAYIHGEVHDPA